MNHYDNLFSQLSSTKKNELAKLDGNTPGKVLATIKYWDWFVQKVKTGYNDYIYEYCNDLDIRQEIEQYLEKSTGEFHSFLFELTKEIDQMYIDSTSKVDSPINAYNHVLENPLKYFWYYRVPKKITPQLAPDLDEHGRKW